MSISAKNIILGICATGLAIGSALADYATNKYKVRTPDGGFMLVRGNGCSDSGVLRCIVKVKTHEEGKTLFERVTLFNQNNVTVVGSSHLLSTFHTLGD